LQQVAIVGGGITGLAAAYFLEKHASAAGLDLAIDLIDVRERLGGVIASDRSNGFLVEGGPDSFLTQKTAAIDLCRALGLSDQLIPSNDRQRKTYILHGGQLKELPDGLMFLLPTKVGPILRSDLFSISGKARLALSSLLSPPPVREDVSVAEFVSRRLGRQALERLAEPLLSAVYGADVNSLSATAVLPRVVEMEQKYGSLWKAVRAARAAQAAKGATPAGGSLFVSLREGIGQLVQKLEKSLIRTRFVTGTEITGIARTESGFRAEATGGGAAVSAVILATPAYAAAKTLAGLDAGLAEMLREIPYHSTLTVSLGFEESAIERALDGFGFVVPRGERKRMVACTWVSTKYPFRSPPGQVLLRCFLGGARDPAILSEADPAVLEICLKELGELMGVRAQPIFTKIYRWDRAMPQYNVGHPGRIKEIHRLLEAHPGLYLAGNAYQGIGIPDCIDSASLAASQAFDYLQSLA
jgi:protoporphyrinogen/coproporphyrinogen III oxidase